MASVFNPGSNACKACPAAKQCRPKALAVLELARGAIPVDQLIMEFREDYEPPARALSLSQESSVASMPVKVAARLRSLLLQGFDRRASAALQQGQNPFTARGAKHLQLAGEMLLAGGFTRSSFRKECQARFTWSEGTAFSQVSQAISLLRGLGLVIDQGDRVVLPALN